MAEKTAMSRRGVAWWGHNATAGICACCGTVGRVYMGYNGGQPMAVQFCGACTPSDHMGCEASAPQLVSDARERLARHLFLDAHPDDPHAVAHWDYGGDQHVNREPWRRKADAALAVATGKDSR